MATLTLCADICDPAQETPGTETPRTNSVASPERAFPLGVLHVSLRRTGLKVSSLFLQRNLLTHPDSTRENNQPETDWNAIWLKGEQLGLLLEVCLLHELGFNEQAIAEVLHRNRRTEAIRLNKN